MENQKQEVLINMNVAKRLNALQKSEISNDAFYLRASNLCDAIITISNEIADVIDVASTNDKKLSPNQNKRLLNLLHQIDSIAEVLRSMAEHEDFELLEDFIYCTTNKEDFAVINSNT